MGVPFFDDALVQHDVVLCHPPRREPVFEGLPTGMPIQCAEAPRCFNCLVQRVDNEPGAAVLQDFLDGFRLGMRPPVCRRPMIRSSPGRTARASRSERAARARCRGTPLFPIRRSHRRIQRADDGEAARLRGQNTRRRRDRSSRQSSAAARPPWQLRSPGRRVSPARSGRGTQGNLSRGDAPRIVRKASRGESSAAQFGVRKRRALSVRDQMSGMSENAPNKGTSSGRSSRPCIVVTEGVASRRATGR